jgi:hypothetical protein
MVSRLAILKSLSFATKLKALAELNCYSTIGDISIAIHNLAFYFVPYLTGSAIDWK